MIKAGEHSYGKLIIERDLTKDEVTAIEDALSITDRPLTLLFDGWEIYVRHIEIDHKEHNVAYLTVKGIA